VRLGCWNVDALLRSLTAKQFHEWMIYAELEPFDEVRGDLRSALIAATIANVNRGKGQTAYTLQDFLLFKEEESPRHQTWQEKKAIAMAICMAYSVPALDM